VPSAAARGSRPDPCTGRGTAPPAKELARSAGATDIDPPAPGFTPDRDGAVPRHRHGVHHFHDYARFRETLDRLFAFAGVWDLWRGAGNEKPLLTCYLITTSASHLVSPVHDRMPVIMARESYSEWLSPETPEAF
jgi:hypothetical protein